MTPGGKMKIPNPYCTSAKDAQSYSSVSIVYSCKCTCSSRDKLYRKRRFTTLIWPFGTNENSETILHIYKTYPIISQSIFCLFYEIKTEFQCQELHQKRHFWAYIWPIVQKWEFLNLLAHMQDMFNQILKYILAMT